MKNLIIPMTFGLILLIGCSKDESFEPTEEQTIDSVYILKQIDGTTIWETTAIDGLTGKNFNYPTDDHNLYGHTNGAFMPAYRDEVIITWSGTEDGTGTRGSAELQMSTPAYSFHFILETECVTVDGDAAVYGGIIVEVVQTSGNPPPFGVNWRFYFKVIDSEQGGGVNYDQISNTRIFASPRSMSLCDEYLPNNRIWSSQGYENVIEPGFVEVSEVPE